MTVLSARAQGNLRRSQGLIDCPATRPDRNWKGAASRRLERDMVGKLVGGIPHPPRNPNNHSPSTNQRSARSSDGPRMLTGLRFGHLALGPRSLWSSPFVARFLLSLSMILSQPTSDPFSPDIRVTIIHELYCLADSFVLTTHFISDSLLFCLSTSSKLFPLILG